MKKILVCQHVPYEILGTLNPLFKEEGFRIRYVNFGRFPELKPGLEGYQGLVILGGPMGVDQEKVHPHLTQEIRMIEEALKKDIPVLGICLGAQLIAKTLGAKVCENKEKEIGWHDVFLSETGHHDPLMKHFQKTEKIFHWHEDTFAIPKNAIHLASSEACFNQAFRYGDKVYGFQFHLEVDEPMIQRWLEVPYHQKILQELKGTPEKIRQETVHHVGRLKNLSELTFSEFIKLFGVQKKYIRLPSR
jgi:GMP synthase (glutamine-hydrolysing)